MLRVKLALSVRNCVRNVIEPIQDFMKVHEGEHLVLCRGRERVDEAAIDLSFIRRMEQYPL